MNELAARMLAAEKRVDEQNTYVAFHQRRFDYLLALCRELKPDETASVLDVGPSPLSFLLAERYRRVVTLGFAPEGQPWYRQPGPRPAAHILFDLGDAGRQDIPTTERFDLIVFGETIEHLHTPPELALQALGSLLKESGFLICQTPNAAMLSHRVAMLFGRNPFERIRANAMNPGHFREYTKQELVEIGHSAGLRPVRHEFRDYYYHPTGRFRMLRQTIHSLVPTLRCGQTIVYVPDKSPNP